VLFTGNLKDTVDVPGVGKIEWSLVDLANPTVFVKAEAVGLKGTEEDREILPSGIMECDAEVEIKDGQAISKKAVYYRTARRIMEGYVYHRPNRPELTPVLAIHQRDEVL
jgi:2-methylaconitate cis-trans-isomerase PrpF